MLETKRWPVQSSKHGTGTFPEKSNCICRPLHHELRLNPLQDRAIASPEQRFVCIHSMEASWEYPPLVVRGFHRTQIGHPCLCHGVERSQGFLISLRFSELHCTLGSHAHIHRLVFLRQLHVQTLQNVVDVDAVRIAKLRRLHHEEPRCEQQCLNHDAIHTPSLLKVRTACKLSSHRLQHSWRDPESAWFSGRPSIESIHQGPQPELAFCRISCASPCVCILDGKHGLLEAG